SLHHPWNLRRGLHSHRLYHHRQHHHHPQKSLLLHLTFFSEKISSADTGEFPSSTNVGSFTAPTPSTSPPPTPSPPPPLSPSPPPRDESSRPPKRSPPPPSPRP
ncbi:hypothetical protein V8G54_001271, partial [Vigna mungo]